MHDPFQTYQALGACSMGASPFSNPYATQTPGIHAGIPQIPGLNPFAAGLQNPLLQNPLVQQALWQQALQQQALQQNPLHAYGQPQQYGYGQPQQFGYGQPQFGHPLAPQSMIGQGQFGGQFPGQFGPQAYGQQTQQLHPLILQQLALRSLASSGITPWAGI